MKDMPRQLTLEQWDTRYKELRRQGLREPSYGGPLSRHVAESSDYRLAKLRYDDSPAALRLWNFLLTEEQRLHQAKTQGKKIIGVMKDLGTVPVMTYSLDNLVAFYPDGTWWIPCITELNTGMLAIADSLGIDESFCPVRAMLGAFVSGEHFPIPDRLICERLRNVRRFFCHRPEAQQSRLSDFMVGNSTQAHTRTKRRSRDPARRIFFAENTG